MPSFRGAKPSYALPLPIKTVKKGHAPGFALFFVIVLLGAVCFFLVTAGEYALLDQRLLKAKEQEEKAKDIALFALDIALAHLENSLGPKNRTSTVPFPYSGPAEAYYTAAWKEDTEGKPAFIGYLVPPTSDKGVFSFFQDNLKVTVPLVALPGEEGYYTYWIGDEGVKAKLNLGQSLREGKNTHSAFMQAQALRGFEGIASESLAGYSEWSSLAKGIGLKTETVQEHYPHLTFKSYRLLTQAVETNDRSLFSLKKDLTAFKTKDIPASLEERLIEEFHRLGQSAHLDSSPHLPPQPYAIKRENPYAPAELDQLGVGPICLAFRLGFDFELESPNTLAVYEGAQVILWNPYAFALDSHTYTLSLLCNKKPSILLNPASPDNPSEQWIDLGEAHVEERGYPYTILKAKLYSSFRAGEKKRFVLKNTSLDPQKPELSLEEIVSLNMQVKPSPRIWIKNEPYLLEAESKIVLKEDGLHAKRHVRRQRVQNPYSTKDPKPQPGIEPKPALSQTRQVVGKTRETPSWPDMALRLESAENAYSSTRFLFHELSLQSLTLNPLVLEKETKDSKNLRSTQLGLEYRLNFRPGMPFQNNPRAFLPPHFKPNIDSTWEWSWAHNQASPFKDYTREDLKSLALFDLGPLDSVGKLRHLLFSLDPNTPMYAEDKLDYWDNSFCPHRLISQKGKQEALEGAFNLNSRSAKAWTNLILAALKPENRAGGTFSRTHFHTPKYELSLIQAELLAQHIVELLNAALPYFSLSSFIKAGVLKKALDKLNLPYQEHPLLALNAFDLLESIGPLLVPVSDTFTIRAHGASFIKKDTTGKSMYRKASCEALVQRVLERKPDTDELEPRFRVLDLRWVEADKL